MTVVVRLLIRRPIQIEKQLREKQVEHFSSVHVCRIIRRQDEEKRKFKFHLDHCSWSWLKLSQGFNDGELEHHPVINR